VIVATPGALDTYGFTAAGTPEPIKVIEPPRHTSVGPLMVGTFVTVIVLVTVQPLLLVYVITVVPLETPVTTPALLTVATPGVPDTHGLTAAGTPEPVNGSVPPTVTLAAPVIVGRALMVTVTVMLQPLLLVYVITLVPADTPVTTPALLTVATAVVADIHGFTAAGTPEPVRFVVLPTHAFNVPVIVGNAFIVTVAVMLQPLLFVYVITLVPVETPVTTPALVTVATPGVADTHGFTAAGTPDPVKFVVAPTHAFNVPVIVGLALMVTVAVILQPLLLV